MKIIEFNGHKLEMFDSIQELNIVRFQKYNMNVMIDAGIGGDLNGFRDRANTVKRLMKSDVEKADKEMDNFVNSVYMIMSGTNPELNSFVVLINKINGRIVSNDDLSEDGIKELQKELGQKGLKMDLVRIFLNWVKKKIDGEFETFFPALADAGSAKESYLMLRKKIGLKMREIGHGIDLSEELDRIEKFFVRKIKVRVYGGAGGMEVKMINGFDDMCTVLVKHGLALKPKELTVVEFYNKLIFLEKMIKENKKGK